MSPGRRTRSSYCCVPEWGPQYMAKLTKVGRIGVETRGNEKIVAGLVFKVLYCSNYKTKANQNCSLMILLDSDNREIPHVKKIAFYKYLYIF